MCPLKSRTIKRKINLIVKEKQHISASLSFSVNFLLLEIMCTLVHVNYFWFLLFVNTRHYHELIRVKHYESKTSTKLYD